MTWMFDMPITKQDAEHSYYTLSYKEYQEYKINLRKILKNIKAISAKGTKNEYGEFVYTKNSI